MCLVVGEVWLPTLAIAALVVLVWIGEGWLLDQLAAWWRLVMRAGA